MSTNRTRDALVGLGYLVLIAALVVLSIMIYNKDFTASVDVTLTADNAGSALQDGADVEVRGVVVGSVRGITSDGDGARIRLALDPAQAHRLPANVTAQLLPKTLFGQRYVNLVTPPAPSSTHLADGDVIGPDRSSTTTELQDVFANLLPVLQAVRPAQLAQTLGAIDASLRNQGNNLGETLQVLNDYLHKFAPKVPVLLADLRRLSSVARTYNGAAPDLVTALRNFTTTSRTLVQQRSQFVDLLHSVTGASNQLGDFVQSNSQDIIDLSRDSLPTLRVLARYSGEFPCLSRALVDFIPVMDSALGKGTNERGLHASLQVVPSRGSYLRSNLPRYEATGGPQCPQVAAAGSNGTAAGATLSSTAGIGTQNSVQENQVIAEMMAPGSDLTPRAYPAWGSLLVGPALRGTTVTLR